PPSRRRLAISRGAVARRGRVPNPANRRFLDGDAGTPATGASPLGGGAGRRRDGAVSQVRRDRRRRRPGVVGRRLFPGGQSSSGGRGGPPRRTVLPLSRGDRLVPALPRCRLARSAPPDPRARPFEPRARGASPCRPTGSGKAAVRREALQAARAGE